MITVHIVRIELTRYEPLPPLVIEAENLVSRHALNAAMGASCDHHVEGRRSTLWHALAVWQGVRHPHAWPDMSDKGWSISYRTEERETWGLGAKGKVSVKGGN